MAFGSVQFVFSRTSRFAPGIHTASYSMHAAFFPVSKAEGWEVDHWLPFNAENKNEWVYTYAPAVRLHGVGSVTFLFVYLQLFIFTHDGITSVLLITYHDNKTWSNSGYVDGTTKGNSLSFLCPFVRGYAQLLSPTTQASDNWHTSANLP